MRKIIHLDMDAYFASVEQRDHPDYRGKPVIVGGSPSSRGVVSTCSYEARKFGVHSAMPLREAGRRCPQGIFLPVRLKRYQEISGEIMAILREYTPLVEPFSIDEAFLDVTGSELLFGSAEMIARKIVKRIDEELNLPASVGVAPNKFLAKIGSDLKKPRGFVVIKAEDVIPLLAPLSVSKLWGVGPKNQEQLRKLGIKRIKDIQDLPVKILRDQLGEFGEHLHRLAFGLDDRPVLPRQEIKSIGHETTFQKDTDDREFLEEVLLGLCTRVARRLRKSDLVGQVIMIKLRDTDFKTITRQTTLYYPTAFEEVIFKYARRLAEENEWGLKPLRLIGVSISGLQKNSAVQLPLFSEVRQEDLHRLHQTVDRIKDRFGEDAITRGSLLPKECEKKKI